jgi:hypothetical protein
MFPLWSNQTERLYQQLTLSVLVKVNCVFRYAAQILEFSFYLAATAENYHQGQPKPNWSRRDARWKILGVAVPPQPPPPPPNLPPTQLVSQLSALGTQWMLSVAATVLCGESVSFTKLNSSIRSSLYVISRRGIHLIAVYYQILRQNEHQNTSHFCPRTSHCALTERHTMKAYWGIEV